MRQTYLVQFDNGNFKYVVASSPNEVWARLESSEQRKTIGVYDEEGHDYFEEQEEEDEEDNENNN